MADLLIVKNITREGPGLLEEVMRNADLTATVVDLHKGEQFPSLAEHKALIVLGGPDSANDEAPKMIEELAQVTMTLEAGMPYLGICLGMQVLVKAAGGDVIRAVQKEVGFVDPDDQQNTVRLTEIGKTDPLLVGLPEQLAVFHLHGETVRLTDSMQLLGTGEYCKGQIIKVADKAYGIQSHFELTETMLRKWATQDPDLLPIGEDSLVASLRAIQGTYTSIGKQLFTNFLKLAGLL